MTIEYERNIRHIEMYWPYRKRRCYVPLHLFILHFFVSVAFPSLEQSDPPLAGRGFVHERVRFCKPSPHDLEQDDQSDHSV